MMQYRSGNVSRKFCLDPTRPGRKRMVSASVSRSPSDLRIVLFSAMFLIAATVYGGTGTTVLAFCSPRLIGHPSRTSATTTSSSALGLFRPDWMRRAGRIEEKRKEGRVIFDSLRKRQDELGIPRTLYKTKSRNADNKKPQMYRVVSSNKNKNYNGTSMENDDDDCLAIYPFVPEGDVEANDESNILDRLRDGEIVTAVRQQRVIDENAAPLPMAVVAATAIYNVQHKIRTDILWIEHDRGGWSPSIVDGVTRLVPVNEDG
eukprot:CAMPEP_0197180950 /NCGR_PEP_ID=MMETSP1423-20130617/5380_1 /TAXON_ID=476441 /ORGANISM="Pseudo-nitzschia heimii, Strain UNC1101" /LENGTH=260 /DNA_ID=CAMNT_0042631099 /DNA_START=185 /DNA_END=964 /DNA_ORIENTATION=-